MTPRQFSLATLGLVALYATAVALGAWAAMSHAGDADAAIEGGAQ